MPLKLMLGSPDAEGCAYWETIS